MQKKLSVNKIGFDESISDLSELICEAKLGAEKEGGGLQLIDNIKTAYSSLNDRLDAARRELIEKESELSGVNERCEELEDSSLDGAGVNEIEGIQTIKWSSDNLLDQQVMERLAELLEKHGSLPVLRALETINI